MQDKRAKVSQAASQEKDNDLSSGTPNLQGSSLSETENWNSIDLRMDDADKSCNDALSSAEAMVTNDDKHAKTQNPKQVSLNPKAQLLQITSPANLLLDTRTRTNQEGWQSFSL